MAHRRLTAALGTVAVATSLIATAATAATKHRTVHITATVTGASIDATHAVFQDHDAYAGNGAGTQIVVVNASGTGGTDSEITYYANGSAKSNGTFTLGAPDANGISTLTGTGHDTSGTGKLKGVKSTYTYTGTLNTKTSVFTVKLTGTYTF